MKTFEVAVPMQYCKKVTIEPSNEFGEIMVVYKFPIDNVLVRNISKDIKKNIFDTY